MSSLLADLQSVADVCACVIYDAKCELDVADVIYISLVLHIQERYKTNLRCKAINNQSVSVSPNSCPFTRFLYIVRPLSPPSQHNTLLSAFPSTPLLSPSLFCSFVDVHAGKTRCILILFPVC